MHHASDAFKRVAQQFLSGERETYATVLLGTLLQAYGAEVLNWDPATVATQVYYDFEVRMPSLVFDQLMALMHAMTTDAVYCSVEVFDQTVNALCRTGLGDTAMPSLEEVAWTVFELTMNDPDPYGTVDSWPFSPDIARYVGVLIADAALQQKPKVLEFAELPRRAESDLADTPDLYAGQWAADVSKAEDIDRFVGEQFKVLSDHLAEIGLEPAPVVQEEAADQLPANPLDQLLGH